MPKTRNTRTATRSTTRPATNLADAVAATEPASPVVDAAGSVADRVGAVLRARPGATAAELAAAAGVGRSTVSKLAGRVGRAGPRGVGCGGQPARGPPVDAAGHSVTPVEPDRGSDSEVGPVPAEPSAAPAAPTAESTPDSGPLADPAGVARRGGLDGPVPAGGDGLGAKR
jgi:hypothetical protein